MALAGFKQKEIAEALAVTERQVRRLHQVLAATALALTGLAPGTWAL
jgi:hypothetical protein